MERTHGPIAFGYHAAAARLAHKYNIVSVMDRATIALQTFFPASFDTWVEHESLRAKRTLLHTEDAIEAVNLLRALSWKDMLPAALYLCSQLRPEPLLQGHRRADRTLERLATDDVARCMRLQKAFVRESADIAARLYDTTRSDGCTNNRPFVFNTCKITLASENRSKILGGGALHGDPLGCALRDQIDLLETAGSVCGRCAAMLRRREEGMRREFWEKLPGLIGSG